MCAEMSTNYKHGILPIIILQTRGGMGSLGGRIGLVTSSVRVVSLHSLCMDYFNP